MKKVTLLVVAIIVFGLSVAISSILIYRCAQRNIIIDVFHFVWEREISEEPGFEFSMTAAGMESETDAFGNLEYITIIRITENTAIYDEDLVDLRKVVDDVQKFEEILNGRVLEVVYQTSTKTWARIIYPTTVRILPNSAIGYERPQIDLP